MQSELNSERTHSSKVVLYTFATILLASVFITVRFNDNRFMLPPLLLTGMVLVVNNYRLLFQLLILSIPVSLHLTFGSLALDFPVEPLMILLTLIFPLVFLTRPEKFNFLFHPVILLIAGGLLWAIYTSLFSVNTMLSVKYLLAKIWFIVPLMLFGGMLVRDSRDIRNIIWLFFVPLLLVCLYVCFVHALKGFSFESSNLIMKPFFPNHVIYSSTIAIFLPFVWNARSWYPPKSSRRRLLNIGIPVFLFSIVVSYTRASWLAVLILPVCFLIVRYKLTKTGIVLGCFGLLAGILYLNSNNKYLDYAKEYQKVIYHDGNLEKHLEATYDMEDISGMERIYRWVAAKNMIKAHWMLGTGPNTFYPEYKKYTLHMFSTYVSDNPEKSTTHNYFLMLLTEQGIPGFLLFAVLYIYLILKGTSLYAKIKDTEAKNLAMATVLSLFMLLLHLLLNDLIETDKIGTLFFLCCLFIIKLDFWEKDASLQESRQDK